MAKFITNGFVQRISGAFGDVVVRQKNGRMFISRRPDNLEPRPPSAGQIEVRNRFKLAAAYARSVMRDMVKRPIYEAVAALRKTQLFSLCAGDFLRPPDITGIELDKYQGKVGNKIAILAVDDVEVMSVRVVIRAPSGTIYEQGDAVLVDGIWIYTATSLLPAGQPATIVATATDRPGNVTSNEKGYVPAP